MGNFLGNMFQDIFDQTHTDIFNPTKNFNPGYKLDQALTLMGDRKKQYSDTPWRDALAEYESKIGKQQEANATAYQAGEDVALHGLQRAAGSAKAGVDQNSIGRGLYNSSIRHVERGKVDQGLYAGYTQVAKNRANFEQSQKPDAGVYGPLIEAVAANPDKTGRGRANLAEQFDTQNNMRNEGARAAFTGGPDSAASRINATPVAGAGLYGSGVGAALARRSGEQKQVGLYSNQAAMGQLDPNQLNYGPAGAGDRIHQLASTPVKQSPIRQTVGALLPVAGAIVGGIYGGPAGAMGGGMAGGAAGAYVGGTDAGISPYGPVGGTNDQMTGAMNGLSFGIAHAPKGGSAGGWKGFFGQSASDPAAPKIAAGTGMPTSYEDVYGNSGSFPSAPRESTANYTNLYAPPAGNRPGVQGGYDIYGRTSTRNWGAF